MDTALPVIDEQRIIARERLRLLEIGCYIRAVLGFLFGCFFCLYIAMFVGMSFIPDAAWENGNANRRQQSPTVATDSASPAGTPTRQPFDRPPQMMFRIMGCVFGLVVLAIWALAGATAYAGRCLRHRRHRLFIQIIAGVNCVFVPYGTLLGVMTLLTLGAPAARLEFEADLAPQR